MNDSGVLAVIGMLGATIEQLQADNELLRQANHDLEEQIRSLSEIEPGRFATVIPDAAAMAP